MSEALRLDKYLSNMGLGTRTQVKKLLKSNEVIVDGEIIKDPAYKVTPGKNIIKAVGQNIHYQKYIYLMMNKPAGYISATEDEKEETVLDLIDDSYTHYSPFPVGRLDKDTEGLLLLTNDGKLAHHLTSPKHKIGKIYYAIIEGEVTEADIIAFSAGVVLDDGYKTLPAKLTIIKSGEYSEIKVMIYEGKYHQVKRMFEAVSKRVKYLKRIQMGSIPLDEELELGQYRELRNDELVSLKTHC